MNSVTEFNRCPKYDNDLHSWALFHPELKESFEDYKTCIHVLANLCNRDRAENSIVEYGFSKEAIVEIISTYREDRWDISNIEEDIKNAREELDIESSYINNVVRVWENYNVPAIDTKEHYEMRSYGILRYVESVSESGEKQFYKKDVCRTPFVLAGISEPLNGDGVYYKIRYANQNGDIKEFWANQSDLLSRKELKTLFLSKSINCPENALLMETMDYISRSISEFGGKFKKEYSAKQNGWNEDKTVFVVGERAISSGEIKPVLSVGSNKGYPELDKKGSIQGWIDGVKDIMDYDLIRFKCYDAMSAPLKSILGVESHATDHYGNTSCGKTFSAQIALSMMGDAEELTIGAKSTAKGILVHIRDFSDLPILIDESSDAGEHLADLVYPLTSNKGRVKSTVDGQRDGGEEFHTTTMFTGERPIRDCLTNSGQQYRVNELDVTLPDLPTKEINAVKKAIRENHGHIIELYIQKVLEWNLSGSLQETYDLCFDKLPANVSNIEGRSRSIFACIMTAGYILEEVFIEIGMPAKKAIPIVKEYYKTCIQEKPVELEYLRALRVVLDWVNSDYGKFAKGFEMSDDVTFKDQNKVYGYVDNIYIDIIGTEFTKKMKETGYSPSKIKEDWWKQGISESNDPVRKGTYRFKRGGKTIAGVRINKNVAEELLDVRSEVEKREPKTQDERVKRVFQIIEFLTELDGVAKINAIRLLANISDIDELLKMMCTNSKKIMKINQDDYIYMY